MSDLHCFNLNETQSSCAASLAEPARVGALRCALLTAARRGGSRERPSASSLRLLPSGSDRVGESTARPTPMADMGEALEKGKSVRDAGSFSGGFPGADDGTFAVAILRFWCWRCRRVWLRHTRRTRRRRSYGWSRRRRGQTWFRRVD